MSGVSILTTICVENAIEIEHCHEPSSVIRNILLTEIFSLHLFVI